MSRGSKVFCLLCDGSDENTRTGNLWRKGKVTAHEKCLLFSSGIYCKNTTESDDLFGFSVEDVLAEVKRGRRLVCKSCGKNGATAGCEVARCKKTYHYPCAIQARAKAIQGKGIYKLYCFAHNQKRQSKQSSRSVDERPSSSSTPTTSRGAGERRARAAAAALSVYNSESNSSRLPAKRHLSDSDKQEELPSKAKAGGLNVDSSLLMELDLNYGEDLVHQNHITRRKNESPTGSSSGNQHNSRDEEETITYLNAESQTVPLIVCKEPQSPPPTTAEPSSQAASNAQGLPENGYPISSSPLSSPVVHPSVSGIDSVSFWKKCNTAGCTQAIFTDFLHEMNEICRRIESDQASQEDYDCALKVIAVSGNLPQLVVKQHKELQKKKDALEKEEAAIKDVISML